MPIRMSWDNLLRPFIVLLLLTLLTIHVTTTRRWGDKMLSKTNTHDRTLPYFLCEGSVFQEKHLISELLIETLKWQPNTGLLSWPIMLSPRCNWIWRLSMCAFTISWVRWRGTSISRLDLTKGLTWPWSPTKQAPDFCWITSKNKIGPFIHDQS